MTTTEKSMTFKGRMQDLDMILHSAVKYASYKVWNRTRSAVKVVWICEDPDTDIHDMVDIQGVESFNCEVVAINA